MRTIKPPCIKNEVPTRVRTWNEIEVNSWAGPRSQDPSEARLLFPLPLTLLPTYRSPMTDSNPGRVSVRRSGHATGPSQSASPVRLSGVVSRKETLEWERMVVTRHYRLFPFFSFFYIQFLFFPFFSRLSNNGHACLFPFLSESGMSRYRSSVVGESTEAEKCRCVVVCV